MRIYNNIIYSPLNKGIKIRDVSSYGQRDASRISVFNNIIVASSSSNAIWENVPSTNPITFNNIIHYTGETGLNTKLNNLFVDYINRNFHIKQGSKANNAGILSIQAS